MFPLPPAEAVFIAELFRYFPDAREVTEGGFAADTGRRRSADAIANPSFAPGVPPSVTSQSSLFDHAPRRAA